MKKFIVNHFSGKYPVFAGNGLLDRLPAMIEKINGHNRVFFVIDKNVSVIYAGKIQRLRSIYGRDNYFIVPSGESSKSYRLLNQIHKTLIKSQYTRNTLIISIGGGVTGDLAGFAAASYLRGVKIIHIPTTIISASDSSIGGKTGINFNNIKNIIGAFHHPEMVLIDTLFLRSLPVRVYNAGLGEIIKYAFITGSEFYDEILNTFNSLEYRDYTSLGEIIFKCARFKASVVEQDEREKGLRKILNFGHTFGHALESATRFRIPHGMAVCGGIISALHLSYRMRLINRELLNKLLELPLRLKLPAVVKNVPPETIFECMIHDKKNTSLNINFILLTGPGNIIIDVNVPKTEIIASIKDLQILI